VQTQSSLEEEKKDFQLYFKTIFKPALCNQH